VSGADRIELRGLRAVGVHGDLPEERDRPQPFELDLDVEADLSASSGTDDLGDTVDYAQVAELAAGVVEKASYRLLERLASAVADAVLDVEGIARVTVTVRKLRPPVAVDLSSAGVRITRSRR
jgi:dihydroneopterin aldolase